VDRRETAYVLGGRAERKGSVPIAVAFGQLDGNESRQPRVAVRLDDKVRNAP
jgi:hypothetical protein